MKIQILGLKQQGRCFHISRGVINKITMKKTEVQDFLGVMDFWRMHAPGYSLIYTGYSLPLYFLRRKTLKEVTTPFFLPKKKDLKRGAKQQQTFEQTKWMMIWASPDMTRCKKCAL